MLWGSKTILEHRWYPSLRCTNLSFHQLKQYPNIIHEVINVSGKYLPLFSLDPWPLHRDVFEGEHQQQQEGDVTSLSLLFPFFPFSLLWSAPIFVDPGSWVTSASSSPSLAWSTITQLLVCFESILRLLHSHIYLMLHSHPIFTFYYFDDKPIQSCSWLKGFSPFSAINMLTYFGW